MQRTLKKLINLCSIYCICLAVSAATHNEVNGFGRVANNMLEPVSLFADVIHAAALVLGASFLFAGVVKYFEHKRSPLMVPISTVVFLFIAGLLLLSLPLMSYMSDIGLHYASFK